MRKVTIETYEQELAGKPIFLFCATDYGYGSVMDVPEVTVKSYKSKGHRERGLHRWIVKHTCPGIHEVECKSH